MPSSTHSRRSRPSSSPHPRRSPSIEVVKTNTIQEYIAAINDIPIDQVTDEMVQEHLTQQNNGGPKVGAKRDRDDEDDDEEQPKKKSKSPSVDNGLSGDDEENIMSDAEPNEEGEGNNSDDEGDKPAEDHPRDEPEEDSDVDPAPEADPAGEDSDSETDIEASPRSPAPESESEPEAEEEETSGVDNRTWAFCAGTNATGPRKGKTCRNTRLGDGDEVRYCQHHGEEAGPKTYTKPYTAHDRRSCPRNWGAECGYPGCWKEEYEEVER